MSFLLTFLLFSQLFHRSNAIVIDTQLGKIEGIQDEFGSYLFRNIPYAAPPEGTLRWRPPQPLSNQRAQNSVFDATVAGNACVQRVNEMTPMMIYGSNGLMSEDCLTLAIETPFQFDNSYKKVKKRRNVLFWVHGGGLQIGTGYAQVPTNLVMNQDIVLVSINYRLGLGGFLVDPALEDFNTGNGGANGILDMIAALEWVRENIADYGGNPDEITIAGESGGAWGVCALLLSPLAKGLFKRSIQMSGTCIDSMGKFFSRQEAWQIGQDIKLSNNVQHFAELRSMDLSAINANFAMDGEQSVLPSVDGYVFPLSTMDILKTGYTNGESAMIGTLFRDSFAGEPWNMIALPQNFEELNAYYDSKLFDTEANLIREYYPQSEVYSKVWPRGINGVSEYGSNEAALILTQQSTDCAFRCGSVWQSDMIASNPITQDSFPVYFYQHGYTEQPYDQATHAFTGFAFFGNVHVFPISPEYVELAQNFFGDYIKGGKVPMVRGKSASLQNGYYIQLVEEVRVRSRSDLEILLDRCEVYKLLGDPIWRDAVCSIVV